MTTPTDAGTPTIAQPRAVPRGEPPQDGSHAPQIGSPFNAAQQDLIHRTNALRSFPRLAARRGSTP